MKNLKNILTRSIYIALFLAMLILSFAASYKLTNVLFKFTIRANELWASVISGILGIFIFWAGSLIIFTAAHKIHPKHRVGQLDIISKALNRIAQGDFDVLVPLLPKDDRRLSFNNLAKTVNNMAKELESMEILRQEFVSNVSHEIQSPLTSISGFVSLLKDESLSNEQRRHYLNIIETESKRMSKLSDNLLELSTLESRSASLNSSTYRLDKQVEDVILMLEPQWHNKNIDVELLCDKITFKGDKELLAQVWVNLIHNAVKFTPDNGKIKVSLIEKDNLVLCKIADNGIGISKFNQIHIFERFFKIDKARERSMGGNGLGLSLVKKIVTMHKGNINLKSEIDEGTEFVITLPN